MQDSFSAKIDLVLKALSTTRGQLASKLGADIPQELRDHLMRDVGPAAFAAGGDRLLRMPIARSLAR